MSRQSDARNLRVVAQPEDGRSASPVDDDLGVYLTSVSEHLNAESVQHSAPAQHPAPESKDAIPDEPETTMPTQVTTQPESQTPRAAADPGAPRFLTMTEQIPAPLRALLNEADGCLRMSFMTGANACLGHALDALLSAERITATDRTQQLKELSAKYPSVQDGLFRLLAQPSTSERPSDPARLTLTMATLKAIAYEAYVLGPERSERATYLARLVQAYQAAAGAPKT
jgi:C4-dicarboxylate-specific signal transduction histidine kinase